MQHDIVLREHTLAWFSPKIQDTAVYIVYYMTLYRTRVLSEMRGGAVVQFLEFHAIKWFKTARAVLHPKNLPPNFLHPKRKKVARTPRGSGHPLLPRLPSRHVAVATYLHIADKTRVFDVVSSAQKTKYVVRHDRNPRKPEDTQLWVLPCL